MLIAHGILPDLLSHLSSYSSFGIAPIFWDQTEGQFKVKKSAITCVGSVITFQLGLSLIVHDLYRQYQNTNGGFKGANGNGADGTTTVSGTGSSSSSSFGATSSVGNISNMEKAYNRIQRLSCALLLIFVALVHGRNMRSAHALVAFFNGMIAFEQKYTGRLRLPTEWKGKLTKYFCLMVRLLNSIGPLLISVLITVSETGSPLNLIEFLTSASYSTSSGGEIGDSGGGGSNNAGNGGGGGGNNDLCTAASSSCSAAPSGITALTGNQLVQRFITGTITALLNIIIWYMIVNIRGFWTCGQILIGCYGIRSALNLYVSIMTRGKLLRITKEKIQEALIYREVQLLANLFNEVHGNPIYVILLLLSSLLQTVSLYIYVRFIATMTSSFYFVPSSWTWTSSRLFIAYMAFDGIFTIFIVFGCCAEVYLTSVQVKAQLQENEVFQRSEWFTQFFLSCPTIKFKVGSTNFISEGKLGCGADHNGNRGSTGGDNAPASAVDSSSTAAIDGNGNVEIAVGAKMASVIVNSNGNGNCSGGGGAPGSGGSNNTIPATIAFHAGLLDM